MIAAVHEILAERGMDGLTVDEVSRRSGVAKSTIYRHFDSVDELTLAAIDELTDRIPTPDTGSFESDLRAVADRFVEVARNDAFRSFFVAMVARGRHDSDFAARCDAARSARESPLRLAVQRGIARGEVDPEVDLAHAIRFAQAPFLAMLVDDAEMEPDEVETSIDLVCRALLPRG